MTKHLYQINSLHISNFRQFEDLTVSFNPHFNIIIGDNGAGKTTLLEALGIAVSSFFLGIDAAKTATIQPSDIRQLFYFNNPEPITPAVVECKGVINRKSISWKRELWGKRKKTTNKFAKNIKNIADELQSKRLEKVLFPVIAYYGNGRGWDERRDTEPKGNTSGLESGYYNSASPTSNHKFFLKWYKTKTLNYQQNGNRFELEVVKNAVLRCIPDGKDLYFDFELDDLRLEFADGQKMPFQNLSDGFRNVLATVADLSFRCVSLNPHLEANAATQSEGFVLIDELDLYLHPQWQKHIVRDLSAAFPNIQFFVTTHSPLVVASAEAGQVLRLTNAEQRTISPLVHAYQGWQLDYILKEIMGLDSVSDANINPALDELDAAFAEKNLARYENALLALSKIVHPDDPIYTVYKLKKANLLLHS